MFCVSICGALGTHGRATAPDIAPNLSTISSTPFPLGLRSWTRALSARVVPPDAARLLRRLPEPAGPASPRARAGPVGPPDW